MIHRLYQWILLHVKQMDSIHTNARLNLIIIDYKCNLDSLKILILGAGAGPTGMINIISLTTTEYLKFIIGAII